MSIPGRHLLALTALFQAHVPWAKERVRPAVIGLGRRMRYLPRMDQTLADRARRARVYLDYRALLNVQDAGRGGDRDAEPPARDDDQGDDGPGLPFAVRESRKVVQMETQ